MISSIKNIYHSKSLQDYGFCKPLKNYHRFFAKKIENCSVLKKLAWSIALITTGIFTYPFFGLLAGLGIAIKAMRVTSLKQWNENQKNEIQGLKQKWQKGIEHNVIIAGLIHKGDPLNTYAMTLSTIDDKLKEIIKDINNYSSRFQKVAYEYLSHSDQELKITLKPVNC